MLSKLLILGFLVLVTSNCSTPPPKNSKHYKSRREAVLDTINEINILYGKIVLLVVEEDDKVTQFSKYLIKEEDLKGDYVGMTRKTARLVILDQHEPYYFTPDTFAHELGHVYGLEHDVSENCILMKPMQENPGNSKESAKRLKSCLDEIGLYLADYIPLRLQLEVR